jgi:hypothetical protein
MWGEGYGMRVSRFEPATVNQQPNFLPIYSKTLQLEKLVSRNYLKNGLYCFSNPIVVGFPWPEKTFVSSSRINSL